MLPLEHPDRIQIAFDDHRLVNNAGLLLPATLAQHVGLRELVDRHLDLGDAPGRANAGDKMLTLAGGDCIDDADALRAGRTSSVLGCMVKGQSALHPGDVPAQLPVGPRPSTRPGEPGTAGPGLGCRCRTRRFSVDHRPGLHATIVVGLVLIKGGQAFPLGLVRVAARPTDWTRRGTPPRLYLQAGQSPAAGCRRRHRRPVDVPAARRPRQHRPGRRPLPA